ncbi:hypothetical protein ACR2U3_27745 [Klebsiella pneumoniae]
MLQPIERKAFKVVSKGHVAILTIGKGHGIFIPNLPRTKFYLLHRWHPEPILLLATTVVNPVIFPGIAPIPLNVQSVERRGINKQPAAKHNVLYVEKRVT